MELTVITFVTIDGVMQGPGGAEEDTSDGFDEGGWMVPFADQDFGEIMDGWFAHAGEFLLGRATYERMFRYWSQVTDPDEVVAQNLNNLPKHIVSRMLRSPVWADSSVIDGDLVEAITALKDEPGGELQVHGSAQLVQAVNQHRLVDEYRPAGVPRRARHRQAAVRRRHQPTFKTGPEPNHQHRRDRAHVSTRRSSTPT